METWGGLHNLQNPPRKSEQWEEWQKLKEKEKQDEHKSSKKL